MSLCIAVKKKNKIYVGCDTQVTYGDRKDKLPYNSNKIWKVENCESGIMASVGQVRVSQLVQCEANLIDELDMLKGTIDYKHIVKKLVSKIFNVVTSSNITINDSMMPNSFIFAYKDKAWSISRDGCVFEIQDYLVIGSGSDIAIGVMDSNKSKPPIERINEAIKVCAEKTLYVNDKIVILNT